MVVLEYHYRSDDPYYNSDASGRKGYYNPTYVPTAYFDGLRDSIVGGWEGELYDYDTAYISRLSYPSACTLNVLVDYNPNNRLLRVSARVFKLDAFSYGRLRYAIAESHIYVDPPWGDAETLLLDSLHHVVRKMLPNYTGVVIPDTLQVGQSFVNSQACTLSTSWDEKNCYVVVFAQNDYSPVGKPILRSFRSGLFTEANWVYGDATGDGDVNSADIVHLINYLFVGGPPPNPPASGDPTYDCNINSADIVYLINYLFVGGPPPLKGCAF